jgi:urease accessory protein
VTGQADLLAMLQHGDSAFPSGAVAFSWGLETLCAEGRIAGADDVAAFIAGQLAGRWADFDRPALTAAYAAAGDLGRVAGIDRLLEAQTLSREMREGSRRAGGALLTVHDSMGTTGVHDYRRRVREGAAPGHAAAVQGLVWHGAGVEQEAIGAMAAHAFATGLLGAALRLGRIGHVDGQRILAGLRPLIADILAAPPPPVEAIRSFTPEAEIAVLRHETADARLFAT